MGPLFFTASRGAPFLLRLTSISLPRVTSVLQPQRLGASANLCCAQLWWRHQMETFPMLLALFEGNPPATGGFPSQRQVTRSLDVFFDLHLNKQMKKQPKRRRFETPSHLSLRHCNEFRHDLSYLYQSKTRPFQWTKLWLCKGRWWYIHWSRNFSPGNHIFLSICGP